MPAPVALCLDASPDLCPPAVRSLNMPSLRRCALAARALPSAFGFAGRLRFERLRKEIDFLIGCSWKHIDELHWTETARRLGPFLISNLVTYCARQRLDHVQQHFELGGRFLRVEQVEAPAQFSEHIGVRT